MPLDVIVDGLHPGHRLCCDIRCARDGAGVGCCSGADEVLDHRLWNPILSISRALSRCALFWGAAQLHSMTPSAIWSLDHAGTVLPTRHIWPLFCQPLWYPEPCGFVVSPLRHESAIVDVDVAQTSNYLAPSQVPRPRVLNPPCCWLIISDDGLRALDKHVRFQHAARS